MGFFKFTCPHCSQRIEADEAAKGQICNCPNCNQEIVICDDPPGTPPLPVDDKPKSSEHKNNDRPAPSSAAGARDTAPRQAAPTQPQQASCIPMLTLMSQVVLIVLLCVVIIIISWPEKWEYKAVKVSGEFSSTSYSLEKFLPARMDESRLTSKLNLLYGKWELVAGITEIETVHPNFGKEDYVTGIQPNTRSRNVILIFRRRKIF